VPKFREGILITVEVMGHQVHAIGKAIRPLFADPVTYMLFLFAVECAGVNSENTQG